MKTAKIISVALILVFLFKMLPASDGPVTPEKLSGPYLGQKPPGIIPEIFAPGFISTDLAEGCSGWGNKMEYFVFQRRDDRKSKLYIINQIEGVWQKPQIIHSLQKYKAGDFTIAPDGRTMVFASRIFLEEIGPEGEGGNIWITEKTDHDWTEPKPVNGPINTKYHDSYPCLAKNKNLYFFSRKPGGIGDSDIYISEFIDGKYQPPINLGSRLNTKYDEWDTYISPDESYMIYCSTMPGGLGRDDLYVTYKQSDGSWSSPVHMVNEINSEGSENRPYVSPDGRYLFYASTISGKRDIYWVDAKIIEKLKPDEFKK
jgi:Tol biopolymer transport system component